MAFLSAKGISFTYPHNDKKALKDVSFQVQQNDYLAVLGMNGSGKSTLARILCGFLEPSCGKLEFATDLRIGIVFQSPDDQIVASVVSADTAFGPQNLGFPKNQVQQCVDSCLEHVGLSHRKEFKTSALSQGQKQKLALAGILALQPDILVLDESAAMLDPVSRASFLDLLDSENAKSMTIVHITHDFDEANRAKTILAIDDGEVFFFGSKDVFFKEENLQERIFCKDEEFINKSKKNTNSQTENALVFENICFSYNKSENDAEYKVFDSFSAEIKKGSLTALTGASGCGKSTLLELAAGLLETDSGRILCNQAPALLLQDSERALFEEFAADDVAFGPKNAGITGAALVKKVKESMDIASLPFSEFAERRTFTLSGGEKRKLALAGIIAMENQVILLDEPTAGLDPKSRQVIMKTLRQLADSGKTVLFSTHRKEEAMIADYNLDISSPAKAEPNSIKNNSLSVRPVRWGRELIAFLNKCGSNFSEGTKNNSLIQKFSPVAKYLVFIALFIGGLVASNIKTAAVFFGFIIIYATLAKYPLKKFIKSFLKILPWILLFFCFQVFFLPTTNTDIIIFSWGILKITWGKIFSGILMILHLFSAFISLSVFVYTMTEQQVLDGLKTLLKPFAVLKLPVRHVLLVAGMIFRFVPMLALEAALIIKVQIIRGGLGEAKGFIGKVKKILPLMTPLFLRTLKRADLLADALTARFYS